MQQLACSIAILMVTVIYLFWRAYLQAALRRRQVLRERLAYLLWVLADMDETDLAMADLLDKPLDVA